MKTKHLRQNEEEKQEQSQKLESLGLLAGNIAHDFNNLLGSILGNIGLALLETPPTSTSYTTCETLKKPRVARPISSVKSWPIAARGAWNRN